LNVYWFCLFFWNFNFTVNLWPCHPPLTFENLVTDISLTPNDLWGFIIRLFKEFLKKNFFDQNPYIGFLRRFFFSDWKLESIERFFGQFTNGDEFIIFRVFAAKFFFVIFAKKKCFFEKLKNKLYIITFDVFLWQKYSSKMITWCENDIFRHWRQELHLKEFQLHWIKSESTGSTLPFSGPRLFFSRSRENFKMTEKKVAFCHQKTTKSYRASAIFMKNWLV